MNSRLTLNKRAFQITIAFIDEVIDVGTINRLKEQEVIWTIEARIQRWNVVLFPNITIIVVYISILSHHCEHLFDIMIEFVELIDFFLSRVLRIYLEATILNIQ